MMSRFDFLNISLVSRLLREGSIPDIFNQYLMMSIRFFSFCWTIFFYLVTYFQFANTLKMRDKSNWNNFNCFRDLMKGVRGNWDTFFPRFVFLFALYKRNFVLMLMTWCTLFINSSTDRRIFKPRYRGEPHRNWKYEDEKKNKTFNNNQQMSWREIHNVYTHTHKKAKRIVVWSFHNLFAIMEITCMVLRKCIFCVFFLLNFIFFVFIIII